MTFLDWAIAGLLVIAFIAGMASGAFPQLGGLFGAAFGGAIAILAILPLARDWLTSLEPIVRTIVAVGGLVICVAFGELFGSAVGRRVRERLVAHEFLGSVDRGVGGLVGLAQGILVTWLVGGLIAIGPIQQLAGPAQNSKLLRALGGVLPPAAEIAGDVGRFLSANGIPELFTGFEPIPAAPVTLPTAAGAARIAAGALGATVRVRSTACGSILTGTGFVVKPGYVVTNAHVVAGGRGIQVGRDGEALVDATPVLFDTKLDIAVLRAPDLRTTTVVFATAVPGRGTMAVALGHPGGANLTVVPAAVTASYLADGRDLYGKATVTRTIVELRAAIRGGDSGGPLVLADGTVGGVVFADARTDPSVGYALSPIEVAARVAPALGRAAGVGVGACLP